MLTETASSLPSGLTQGHGETLRNIGLDQLIPSSTQSQAERRATFKKDDLKSLAETIRTDGVVQPIIVRCHPEKVDHFEIIAGERRWLAAKLAGLQHMPAIVVDYSDDKVIQIQLIENLQRVELNPMAEAEGYEELLKRHHLSIEGIAEKVGKRRDHIAQTLKLLALCPKAREACRKGVLKPAVGLVIALITDHAQQKKALEVVSRGRWNNGPMSAAEAMRYVQEEFLLRLDQAPFPTEDETLVPQAGPCGRCPKKTGNQPGLFSDVRQPDLCTDSACFRAKQQAATRQRLERAHAAGQRIIEGKEAKRIVRAGTSQLQEGWVTLDNRCSQDPKNRTYRELLGKKFTPALIVTGDSVLEACDRGMASQALKERGVTLQTSSKGSARERAERARARQEVDYRRRLAEAVRDKTPRILARGDLEAIARTFFAASWHEIRGKLIKQWQWHSGKAKGYVDHGQVANARIPKLSDGELVRLLCDLAFATELQGSSHCTRKPAQLLAAAKRRGISIAKLRTAKPKAETVKGKAPHSSSRRRPAQNAA